MPRKALYDVQQVLTLAVDVFQEHGYHGTIMDELIARTDFNRRGFYLEFGSKQAFLYAVLEHYQQQQLQPLIALLQQNQGLASIQAFFSAYIAHVQGRGCLLINSITELGVDDAKVRSFGRHYLDSLELGFIGCLEKAQQHGQIRNGVQIESCALQLTQCVQGLAVNAILANDAEELQLAIQTLLAFVSATTDIGA